MSNEVFVMAFRRTVKNVVRNFNDIEVKVREATSNDPWGPSSSLMGEIADATYNVSAFSSIMSMLWKRLNDHGKNWRHVYKSLTVLDYIIKTGSERVAQQCRENLFAIQTLKDFQFIDKDGKDQGVNVREKSKQIVSLLKDDERLKNERQRALKAKERFAQSQGGVGNKNFRQNKKFTSSYPTATGDIKGGTDDNSSPPDWDSDQKSTDSQDGKLSNEYEKARPSNEAEEEMQLQIALAMSREEAEQDKKLEDGDQKRLAMAMKENGTMRQEGGGSTLLDLTAPSPGPTKNATPFDPWASPGQAPAQEQPSFSSPANSPWGTQTTNAPTSIQSSFNTNPQPQPDPWAPITSAPAPAPDPWNPAANFPKAAADPWTASPQTNVDPWATSPVTSLQNAPSDPFGSQLPSSQSNSNGFDPRADPTDMQSMDANNPFDLSGVSGVLPQSNEQKSDFLGTNSKLVNLDDILGSKISDSATTNPFATTLVPKATNPFAVDKPKAKSINELRSEQSSFVAAPASGSQADVLLPTPLLPDTSNTGTQSANPFLL